MKVALFGGTGFVGCYLVEELLQQGHEVTLMVRQESAVKNIKQQGYVKLINGLLQDQSAIQKTITGAEVIIYLAGIIREFPSNGASFEELHFQSAKRVIDEARNQGVNRFILMSALGVKPGGTEYQKTKFLAEEYLKAKELDWTIFRPALIFGDPKGKVEFCTQLKKDMLSLPFPAPAFFSKFNVWKAGQFLFSPIHVTDVAKIFVKALDHPGTSRKVFELGGPDIISWNQILTTICKAWGKKKWRVPVPAWGIKMVASIFDRFSWFPVSKDQITMLMEGSYCKSNLIQEIFKVELIPFTKTSLKYIKD